jgi:PBP1b-binding outer membrane lipoprotein LpoB
MSKVLIALWAALFLAGCVSEQNALQVQAKADFQTAKEQCDSESFKTHIERANCLNDAFRRTEYVYANDKDLLDQMMAQRELLSARIDRHELTKEEADLQFAQFKSGLVEQENQRRQQQQDQHRANTIAALSIMQQMNPPQQPLPVYQMPVVQPSHAVNCTSTPLGGSVYTNCY